MRPLSVEYTNEEVASLADKACFKDICKPFKSIAEILLKSFARGQFGLKTPSPAEANRHHGPPQPLCCCRSTSVLPLFNLCSATTQRG
jgi:hypothetical protein